MIFAHKKKTDVYDTIKYMRLSGKADEEIMINLGLSKKSFNRYIPYTKGIYGLKKRMEKK